MMTRRSGPAWLSTEMRKRFESAAYAVWNDIAPDVFGEEYPSKADMAEVVIDQIGNHGHLTTAEIEAFRELSKAEKTRIVLTAY